MYKADDIAKNIINYSYDNGIAVTNLKLQILMYYIQSYSISERNCVLFVDEFLKYLFGPAIDSVYHSYRCYADQPIERQNVSMGFVYENGILKTRKTEFSYADYKPDDRIMMSLVIEGMKNYGPWDLVPHVKEEEPWKSAKNIRDVITVESISNYFRQETNKNRLFGVFDGRK